MIDMFDSVDLIIGMNSYDGTVSLPGWMSMLNMTGSDPAKFKVSRPEYEDILIPVILQAMYQTKLPDIVTDLVKLEFTDWSDSSDDAKRLTMLATMATDLAFAIPLVQTANKHAEPQSKSTYVYRFATQLVPHHVLTVPDLMNGPMVANHIDEVMLLFRQGDPTDMQQAAAQVHVTAERLQTQLDVSSQLITMWTNFAKTGDPNKPVSVASNNTAVSWPQYGAEEYYLQISPYMSVHKQISHKSIELFQETIPKLLQLSQCKPCKQPGNNQGFLFG